MAQFPLIYAGQRITAGIMMQMIPLQSIKPATQSVTSSTVLVNDNDIVLAVAANATYEFECYLDYTGGTQGASDLKWTWSVPASSALKYGAIYSNTAGVLVFNHGTGSNTLTAGTNGAANLPVIMKGEFTTGGSAGNIQLQWAQNTSNATPTTLNIGSMIKLVECS